MKCRYQKRERDCRGAAMVAVLCLLAVFLTLALSLLFAASAMVSTAGKELESTWCRIRASELSDRLGAELSDAESDLSQYVRVWVESGDWQDRVLTSEPAGTGAADAHSEQTDFEYTVTLRYQEDRLQTEVLCVRDNVQWKETAEYERVYDGIQDTTEYERVYDRIRDTAGNSREVNWKWAAYQEE